MYFLMTNKVGIVVEEEGLTWKWKVTQNILWLNQEHCPVILILDDVLEQIGFNPRKPKVV